MVWNGKREYAGKKNMIGIRRKVMEMKVFIDKIGLNKAASDFVMGFEMAEDVYLQWKELFDTDLSRFLEKIEETEGFEQTALYLYVRFAMDAYEWYQKEGIADEVYFLTMRDIAIWADAYEKKNGCPGLRELGWINLSIKGKLFRLGRLQFEPKVLTEEIKAAGKSYPKGMKVLNVHIPEDGKLSTDACGEAFDKAEEFFGSGRCGLEAGWHYTYICESWLLSPVLKNFLDEESNIIAFQNRFEVYDVVYDFRQAEERVFGEILEDIEKYPENTRLQKGLKEWLRVHPENIGMGAGVVQL